MSSSASHGPAGAVATGATAQSHRSPAAVVPRWAVVSAALAPVAMIGGWTLAAARQGEFDSIRETISALAAAPAAEPGIMTAGLAVTGACHVVTAAGLRSIPLPGRVLLAVAGLATAAVAALPVDRWPQPHGVAAGVAFVGLAVWPAGAWRRPTADGRALRPGVAAGAVVVLTGLLLWFLLELQQLTPDDGAATGLSERVLAGAQSLWPLATVVLLRGTAPRRRRAAKGSGSAR